VESRRNYPHCSTVTSTVLTEPICDTCVLKIACHIAQQAAPFLLVIGASMLFEFATPSGYVIRVKLSVFLLAAVFALLPI